jgi:hypothetical protein
MCMPRNRALSSVFLPCLHYRPILFFLLFHTSLVLSIFSLSFYAYVPHSIFDAALNQSINHVVFLTTRLCANRDSHLIHLSLFFFFRFHRIYIYIYIYTYYIVYNNTAHSCPFVSLLSFFSRSSDITISYTHINDHYQFKKPT